MAHEIRAHTYFVIEIRQAFVDYMESFCFILNLF